MTFVTDISRDLYDSLNWKIPLGQVISLLKPFYPGPNNHDHGELGFSISFIITSFVPLADSKRDMTLRKWPDIWVYWVILPSMSFARGSEFIFQGKRGTVCLQGRQGCDYLVKSCDYKLQTPSISCFLAVSNPIILPFIGQEATRWQIDEYLEIWRTPCSSSPMSHSTQWCGKSQSSRMRLLCFH